MARVDDRPQGSALEIDVPAKLQVEMVMVHSTDEATHLLDADSERFAFVVPDRARSGGRPPVGPAIAIRLRDWHTVVPLAFHHGEFAAGQRAGHARRARKAAALGEAVVSGELLALPAFG